LFLLHTFRCDAPESITQRNALKHMERLDLRVAEAICQVCEVPLSELITFETPKGTLHRLSAAKQKRLDTLITKNNARQLIGGEREELRALVREAEEMILANARILAGQRQTASE
jgi:hypothetical protein